MRGIPGQSTSRALNALEEERVLEREEHSHAACEGLRLLMEVKEAEILGEAMML